MRASDGAGQVARGGQAGGRLGQGRQQRGLGQTEPGRRFAEIGLGRGVHAISIGPEEHAIQVKLENFILAHHVFQAPGEQHFLRLALEGLVGGQEQGLGDLLSQGRSALDDRAR